MALEFMCYNCGHQQFGEAMDIVLSDETDSELGDEVRLCDFVLESPPLRDEEDLSTSERKG